MTGTDEQTSYFSGLAMIAGLGDPLLWFHCDTPRRLEKLAALSEAVLQSDESAGVVLSFPQDCTAPPEIPRRLCIACEDDGARLARLLGQGAQISTALLATRSLDAALVATLTRRRTRILVAEMPAPRTTGRWAFIPGHARRVLARVAHVYLAKEDWLAQWQGAGVPADRLSVIGTLSQAPLALKCNEAEREALADALRQRTVWLAAGVPPEEEERVIAVQQEALRETHRLALILHPADPMRGPALYDRFAHQFNMALRSRAIPCCPKHRFYCRYEPGAACRYRWRSPCYMGGSLTPARAYSPLRTRRCLGLLYLHGPESGPVRRRVHRHVCRAAGRRGVITRPRFCLGAR